MEIARFCRYVVFVVTKSGIRSVLVKPAGKKEVIVTAKGIHPNTREDGVMHYLGKFGKVFTGKVVYGMYSDGPLKGMRNGDRSYKMEIKPSSNLGSFHVIDGQKVTLRYPGQQQTCGRCHQTPQKCKGKGIARRCEAEGGIKIEFTDYILDLWKRIEYSPDNLDLSEIIRDESDSVSQQEGGTFTTHKVPVSDTAKYPGVSIRQFPRETDHGKIIEFLVKSGLPENKKENISISSNGTATITDLENSECLLLIESVHEKKNFDKKLYCNGIVPLTPKKPASPLMKTDKTGKPLPPPVPISPMSPSSILDKLKPGLLSTDQSSVAREKPLPPVEISSSGFPSPKPVLTRSMSLSPDRNNGTSSSSRMTFSPNSRFSDQFSSTLIPTFKADSFPDANVLVRRHSMSLFDRTPPSISLAAELLQTQSQYSSIRQKTSKSILSNIADIQDALSEFGSCREESSSSSEGSESSSSVDGNDESFKIVGPRTLNERKRSRKNKRKLALTPGKEQFLKKPNTQISPK